MLSRRLLERTERFFMIVYGLILLWFISSIALGVAADMSPGTMYTTTTHTSTTTVIERLLGPGSRVKYSVSFGQGEDYCSINYTINVERTAAVLELVLANSTSQDFCRTMLLELGLPGLRISEDLVTVLLSKGRAVTNTTAFNLELSLRLPASIEEHALKTVTVSGNKLLYLTSSNGFEGVIVYDPGTRLVVYAYAARGQLWVRATLENALLSTTKGIVMVPGPTASDIGEYMRAYKSLAGEQPSREGASPSKPGGEAATANPTTITKIVTTTITITRTVQSIAHGVEEAGGRTSCPELLPVIYVPSIVAVVLAAALALILLRRK